MQPTTYPHTFDGARQFGIDCANKDHADDPDSPLELQQIDWRNQAWCRNHGFPPYLVDGFVTGYNSVVDANR